MQPLRMDGNQTSDLISRDFTCHGDGEYFQQKCDTVCQVNTDQKFATIFAKSMMDNDNPQLIQRRVHNSEKNHETTLIHQCTSWYDVIC